MRFHGIGLSFLCVSLLAACGGGSGDATPVVTTGGLTGGTTGVSTSGGLTGGTTGVSTSGGLTGGTTGASTTGGTTGTGTGGSTGGTSPLAYVTPPGVAECSVDDIKGRVDFDMRDYYIYYDQVPTLNLANYDSGDELIQALRVNPDIYSSVRDEASNTSLFAEGVLEGFGFALARSADDVIRIRDIHIGSPAHGAGMLRGDELISINGRPFADFTSDELVDVLGSSSTAAVTMTIRSGVSLSRTVRIRRQEYRWVTAAAPTRYTVDSNPSLPKVGYLSIGLFLAPTKNEIDIALKQLEDAGGVDELIIDLRYNGGGRTSVAQYLASVVGGAAVEGKVLLENRWNDKYSPYNETAFFERVDNPLNSPRVFVLTTSATASSSELFINALKPYIDVVVIGDTTAGKPFSSRPLPYCGKSISAMTILRVNSAGVSVAGGITPDCRVADSWNTPADSLEDPLISAALTYAAQGVCTTTIADSGLERKAPPVDQTIWPIDLPAIAIED